MPRNRSRQNHNRSDSPRAKEEAKREKPWSLLTGIGTILTSIVSSVLASLITMFVGFHLFETRLAEKHAQEVKQTDLREERRFEATAHLISQIHDPLSDLDAAIRDRMNSLEEGFLDEVCKSIDAGMLKGDLEEQLGWQKMLLALEEVEYVYNENDNPVLYDEDVRVAYIQSSSPILNLKRLNQILEMRAAGQELMAGSPEELNLTAKDLQLKVFAEESELIQRNTSIMFVYLNASEYQH